MIRSVLILCTGILAATCFACTPTPPPAEAPVSPTSGRLLAACLSSPASFPSRVTMLSPGYDPSTLTAPVVTNPPPLLPEVKKDLIDAFTAAPLLLRAALCGLDGIYVDPSATTSWGFRDPNSHQRYIGLALSLWGNGGNSPPSVYSAYESSVLNQISGWPPASSTVPPQPEFSPAMSNGTDVDTSALTLVAVFAHEYGHILWYDKVKGGNYGYYPYIPNKFCQGSGTDFFDGSWTPPVSMPNSWVGFGAPSSNTPVSGTGSVSSLQAAIQAQQWANAGSILNTIYTTVWPSLLGAVSPEEDFADTVKLLVLTQPLTNQGHPVTSMPLNIYTLPGEQNPDYNPDVFAGLSRRVLLKKLRCIASNSSG